MNTSELVVAENCCKSKLWEDLYDKYAAFVLNLAYSIVKDKSIAEDILQETFIKVNNSLNPEQDETAIKVWILTIARNISINIYNRRKREILCDFQENEDQYKYTEAFEAIEENEFIKKILNLLDENERQIVVLYVLMGYKHKEISKIMSKPESTTKWIYQRALKKLKAILIEDSKRGCD